MKLFGGASGARTASGRAAAARIASQAAPVRNPLKALAVVLAVILLIEAAYFFAIFSRHPFISKWRNVYISTAMDTMSHQWLATAIIPPDIIEEVVGGQQAAMEAQDGLTSQWEKEEPVDDSTVSNDDPTDVDMIVIEERTPDEIAEDEFFNIFHEVDPLSFQEYLDEHPDVLNDGWSQLRINEAGLDDEGTSILTIYGEQVLAIDYPNKILLVRVKGDGYQGVLAVAKDPSRLTHRPSSQLGKAGETVGTIAAANNGILAMNGSGFMDDNGGGDGGTLTGYAMFDGVSHGYSFFAMGEKRLELHDDNLMYIYDTSASVNPNCTDAVEWHPAIIVDGKDVLGLGWDGLHPRACIGQSDKYEILMLAVEGRQPLRSLGITLYDCADILLQHGCMQAMNLDGGTSAMMWYDGEYIIKCSNAQLPQGRPLPTAFVYARSE